MGTKIRRLGLLAVYIAVALATCGDAALAAGVSRGFSATLSPSPGDVALLQIDFPGAGHAMVGPHGLRVVVRSPFGDDYLALAAPRRGGHGGKEALVAVANRPSALLDPTAVHLRLTAAGSLGRPVLRHLTNILYEDHVRAPAGLCSLTAAGRPLAPASLRLLEERGTAVGGFSAAAAVAASYDGACDLPFASEAFRSALTGESGSGSGSCTAGACESTPAPPSPGQPRCAPCDPRPGFACPLVVSTAICVASRDETAASTSAR